MDIQVISQKVAELTEELPEVIKAETILSDLEAWDSLAMVTFLVFASTELGVEVLGRDLRKAVTVSDLYKIVLGKTGRC